LTPQWKYLTPKFAQAVEQLRPLTRDQVRRLRGGELIAFRSRGFQWVAGTVRRPAIDPEGSYVLLSSGRDKGDPDLAFECVHRLSEILYELPPDPPEALRGSQLVAATWYHPEWDWYVNEPRRERNGDVGFPTTDGMWGTIRGQEFEADRMIVVCDAWSEVPEERRQKLIKKGGWPTPKDWSPRGRLPRRGR